MFERTLVKLRDELKSSFNSFAADTQRAYQQLRKETVGEKRFSMALLTMLLLEIGQDLQHIVEHEADAGRRRGGQGLDRSRRGRDRARCRPPLRQQSIQQYDAVLGSPYNPALHERVGSERVEGMGPLLVAEHRQAGLRQPAARFRPATAQGDRLGIVSSQ